MDPNIGGLGPVIITAREVYDAVIKVGGQVAELNSKVANLTDDQMKTSKDHEDRIRSLEKNRWPLPALTVLISLAALAAAIVLH